MLMLLLLSGMRIWRGSGIEYINDYFNEELELPKADIITSTNVFQHTPGVEKFLAAVRKHLADTGVWILEFPLYSQDI